MTSDRPIRAALAQKQILLSLMRRSPDLSDSEVSALAEEALKSGAAQSYVLGSESSFNIADSLDHADFSEVGRMVHSHRASKAQAPDNPSADHSAALAGMTPLQMLEYARSRGLK